MCLFPLCYSPFPKDTAPNRDPDTAPHCGGVYLRNIIIVAIPAPSNATSSVCLLGFTPLKLALNRLPNKVGSVRPGATCRSPPSCGARRQHATPPLVISIATLLL